MWCATSQEGGIDNADVSHLRMFQLLAKLLNKGKSMQTQVESLKCKYAKLPEAVLQMYRKEESSKQRQNFEL
jgi:hypothetical protein